MPVKKKKRPTKSKKKTPRKKLKQDDDVLRAYAFLENMYNPNPSHNSPNTEEEMYPPWIHFS